MNAATTQAILEEAPQADSPFVIVMKIWARWMTGSVSNCKVRG